MHYYHRLNIDLFDTVIRFREIFHSSGECKWFFLLNMELNQYRCLFFCFDFSFSLCLHHYYFRATVTCHFEWPIFARCTSICLWNRSLLHLSVIQLKFLCNEKCMWFIFSIVAFRWDFIKFVCLRTANQLCVQINSHSNRL